jgi:hypothetical protein
VHFTGGAGGPTNLPHTGLSFGDQVAYGAALIFGGAGTLLLAPRRRVRRGKTLLMPLVPLSAALAPTPA